MKPILPLVITLLAACGGAPSSTTEPDPQLPPVTTSDALDSWISSGVYKKWACEAAAHDGRSPSPHGKNRICSNAKLSGHTTGEYPVGAASVKELFDGSGAVAGHAVAVKTKAGGGEAWFWYEKMGASVAVIGQGDSGDAKSVCVGCHQGAGSDAMHSGHDLIYTQVK